MNCPDPGVYPDISFEDYAAWDAMNASTLVQAIHDDGLSMQKLKAVIDGRLKKPQTKALRVGRALHTRLLEPHLYESMWCVAKPCSQIMKSGKRKGECCGKPGIMKDPTHDLWVCGQHPLDGYEAPEDFISADEGKAIEEIRRRIMTHPRGQYLHTLPGSEVSIVFDLLGVRCKARLDKYAKGNPVLPDIKKFAAGRLTRHRWETQAHELAYGVKAAFYIDGLESLTGDKCVFQWVVCEDGEPYHVAFVDCLPEVEAIGRDTYRKILDAYKRALKTDYWPGPFEVVEKTWMLPRHVMYQAEQMGII